MLERIRIQNFQAHEDLKITFDPKLTVIVGPSDVGKSAVIRALEWVMLNNPKGDAIRKQGTKRTTVKILIDGLTIGRIRTASENVYFLGDREFKAFRDDPPEDISKAVQVSRDLNFQRQHDPIFWFSSTAGEVARSLNAIVDLGIIDESLSNLAAGVRSSRAKVEELTASVAEYQQKLRGFDDFQEMESVWHRIKDHNQVYTDALNQAEGVEVLINQTETHRRVVTRWQSVGLVWRGIETAREKWDTGTRVMLGVEALITKAIELSGPVSRWTAVRLIWERIEQAVDALRSVSRSRKSLSSLLAEAESHRSVIDRAGSREALTNHILTVDSTLTRMVNARASFDRLFETVKEAVAVNCDTKNAKEAAEAAAKKFSETFPACPVCGGSL